MAIRSPCKRATAADFATPLRAVQQTAEAAAPRAWRATDQTGGEDALGAVSQLKRVDTGDVHDLTREPRYICVGLAVFRI